MKVQVSETIDRGELFGGMDRNLRLVEKDFDVDIIQRDNELILKGAHTIEAGQVIEEMMSVLEKGEKLDEQKINYITELNDRGISYKNENPGKDIICFTFEGKPLRPKTIGQKGYVDTIRKKDIVFGIGPAGTGKTYIAVAMAVNAFKNKEIQKIILARPAVEAGERLGFLPGDLQEKVDPYLRPLYDALYDVLGRESALRLKEKEAIEVVPLAYMRGRTLDNSFIILDEAQNTTPEQMKMFLTRMGFNSKIVVTGDVTQIDLPRGKRSGLVEASRVLKDIKEIGFCYMKDVDVVRHQLVKKVINAYDDYYSKHPPKDEEQESR
ncbi:MAG: PhoH family protein [Lentihominibacter sp.]|nr:PhoH family protein [Clostridiales bacterium]MDY2679138.1 PhoH family protein [Lentihominibacter sp.]